MGRAIPQTRPSLLIRLRDPDNHTAWKEFLTIYTPIVFGYCRKKGLQEADAFDLVQEVLKAVATAIPRFRYDRKQGSFRGWLLTITRNKLSNHFSLQQRQPTPIGQTSINRIMSEHLHEKESLEWEEGFRTWVWNWACQKARSEVSSTTWQVFWMTAVEGESAESASVKLNLSVGAIYVAKSRVLARLKSLIAEVDESSFEEGDASS